MSDRVSPIKTNWLVWTGLAIFLPVTALILRYFSTSFGPDEWLINMPVAEFVFGFLIVSVLFWWIAPIAIKDTSLHTTRAVLMLVVTTGLFARLVFLGTPAVLESDYNRYLWDGAVVAHGLNPYAFSQNEIFETAKPSETLYTLQEQSGDVFDRINHPQFSTVYPPIAQAAFALSYFISPFSLDAWRLVLLVFEIGTLAFVLLILKMLDKSALWSTLYWLNPLVIKEVANSAHMEPLLMLPVMGAVWLTLKSRHALATIALVIGAGVKIWPMLLALPLWRQMFGKPMTLIANMLICSSILGLLLFPIVLAGLSPKSGFVAFAGQWNSSSALYLIVLEILSPLANLLSIDLIDGPRLARLFLAIVLLVFCAGLCLREANNNEDLIKRMFLITVAIYLLAPSHTPWYFLWLAPFLCIYPVRGLLLAGATLSLHYAYFYYLPRDLAETYQQGIVWLIWVPVWLVLAFDLYKQSTAHTAHA